MHLNSYSLYPCKRGHKMHLNKNGPKPFNASEDTKCISTSVDQTHPMPMRTQNVSQHVLKMTENASQHVLTKTPART